MGDVVNIPAWFTPGIATLVLAFGCVLNPIVILLLVGLVS